MARQQQSAGEQSQQYQAGRNLHVHGVSAADVVEITRVEVARVLDELSAAAESVAAERLERFKAKIVEEFAEDEGLRSAFADPDFQFSLGDASRAAVSNDDQHTEDLLVQLLKNRAEQGNYSRVRLATSYAIRAADKLSLDALHGLTGVWALSSLSAHTPGVAAQLVSSQSIAVSLSAMGLPEDHTWAQDADALNLVRGGLNMTRRPYRQILTEGVTPYLNPGIDAENAGDLIGDATSQCPWLTAQLAPHPLKPGFVVLPGATEEEFMAMFPAECERSPELDQLIEQHGFGRQDATATAAFTQRINQLQEIIRVCDWWDQVPAFSPTVVGTVIGFVNARRYVRFGGAQTVGELLGPSGSVCTAAESC